MFAVEAWNDTGVDLRPDINIDGFVDGADLTILLGTWGDCPEI